MSKQHQTKNQVQSLIMKHKEQIKQKLLEQILEDTASYAGLLLAPAGGFAVLANKEPLMRFLPILGHFWSSVVTKKE